VYGLPENKKMKNSSKIICFHDSHLNEYPTAVEGLYPARLCHEQGKDMIPTWKIHARSKDSDGD
jgi:hypothetical protein